jgi:thiamine biosynthesis lipoprotein
VSAPTLTDGVLRFACFGTTVGVRATGDPGVLHAIRGLLEEVHQRLTRFDADSELCRLNVDPRALVPASPVLRRFAGAVAHAGRASGGLVDATCLPLVEAAGYTGHLEPGGTPAPGRPLPGRTGAWADVGVEGAAVRRPPGVRLDSGGIGKGLAADLAAELLADRDAWAVDCGGDLRVGGRAGAIRAIEVADPWDAGDIVATLRLTAGAVATSGTTRRAWAAGHHLIDPRTGRCADTGIAQVTAVAPTGLQAEVRAKAALLAGRAGAARRLPDGGVVVLADGTVQRVGV